MGCGLNEGVMVAVVVVVVGGVFVFPEKEFPMLLLEDGERSAGRARRAIPTTAHSVRRNASLLLLPGFTARTLLLSD